MTWRGFGALLVLTVVGAVAGFGAAALTGGPSRSAGSPTPVAASGPAYPYTPPVTVLPDPTDPPPLRAPFRTRKTRLGAGAFSLAFPVPAGWEQSLLGPGEARWAPPGSPVNTYSLRVELVASQTRTPQQMVQLRIDDLGDDTRIADLRILDSTASELSFSFVLDDHRRLSVIRWVTPRGTPNAELEIAATGRVDDRVGLEALVGLITASARP